MQWVKSFGSSAETIDYKTFLVYLDLLNQKKISRNTLKGYVLGIKHYFNYLVIIQEREDNPIESIHIKKVVKSVFKDLLEAEELDNLYHCYDALGNDSTRKRNKIILGLLVYQGLTTHEIYNLKLENILLNQGKIEITATKTSNGRILELKAWQMPSVLEYLNQIRTHIIHQKNKDSEQLFLSAMGKLTLLNSLKPLNDELKLYNKRYNNFKQIRASVIVNWLKINHLRKVQYMAGHRYISSTEKYLQSDLKGLQDMIDSFHPIK